MTFKKSLLIALLSFGIANAALAETDEEKFSRAVQYDKQQNYSAAFPLYKELAEKGNPAAQTILAIMYNEGEGITQNHKQAVYWYQKAAEQGFVEAQFNLAFIYENGKGVPQNDKQAFYWYQKAAEQGYANAQFNLAFMYAKIPDYQQSFFWYEKAAEQGYAPAQGAIGFLYKEGVGVRRDIRKAKYYYGLACDGGNNKSCEMYAELDKQGVK